MDLITHLPCFSAGYDLVYTIVDWLSDYIYFVSYVEIISAEGLSQLFLCTIVTRHGMLHRIILDYDRRFTLQF